MSFWDIRRDALPHKSPDIRRETSISFRITLMFGIIKKFRHGGSCRSVVGHGEFVWQMNLKLGLVKQAKLTI